MKRFFYIIFAFLILFLFLFQTLNRPYGSECIHPNGILHVNKFPFIVYPLPGNRVDFTAIQNFLDEIHAQQIIPTGPLFILYSHWNPETKLFHHIYLCVPTAEGTMVKPPLDLQYWNSSAVLTIQMNCPINTLSQLNSHFFQRIHYVPTSPKKTAIVRLLDFFHNFQTSRSFQTEIWIPYQSGHITITN